MAGPGADRLPPVDRLGQVKELDRAELVARLVVAAPAGSAAVPAAADLAESVRQVDLVGRAARVVARVAPVGWGAVAVREVPAECPGADRRDPGLAPAFPAGVPEVPAGCLEVDQRDLLDREDRKDQEDQEDRAAGSAYLAAGAAGVVAPGADPPVARQVLVAVLVDCRGSCWVVSAADRGVEVADRCRGRRVGVYVRTVRARGLPAPPG